MKHLFLLLSFALTVMTANGQSYRSVIAQNPRKSASNYSVYPSPKGPLAPSPAGYRPFYMSHYGRHGSRFLIDPRQYSRPVAILAHADSLGMLTAKGRSALASARAMAAAALNRYGELTHLGALQHRQIAYRMEHRFPEIFADTTTTIQARSTVVIRCILSMENELQELLRYNSRLKIDCDASEHDMYYMNNYKDTMVQRLRKSEEVRKAYSNWVSAHVDNRPLMHRLFNNATYADTISSADVLAADLFHLATIAQNSEIGDKIDLYNLFTTDELYHLWQQTNVWWYLNYGASAVSGGRMPWAQRFLVRNIVDEADSCLRLSHPNATMRFGHESVVLPLVCLLDIDGYGVQTADLDSLEALKWINTNIYPMGCNVQFVFYKPTDGKSDKPVLVKVLLNEEEATLPIRPYTLPRKPRSRAAADNGGTVAGVYYSWPDVRQYLLSRAMQGCSEECCRGSKNG